MSWRILNQSFSDSQVREFLPRSEKSFQQLLSRDDIGFFDMDLLQKGALATSALAQKLKGTYDQLAILGIGGSCLGTQALIEMLQPELIEDQKILFFDNVDGKSFYRKLKKCGPKTLWVLISKSGTTFETLAQAEHVDQWLRQLQRPSLMENALAITESKPSPLWDWAQKHEVPALEIPLNVGGRFSVLTAVGLFPAAFFGLNTEAILMGASQALQDQRLLHSLSSQLIASQERHDGEIYFFPYCDDLRFWSLWGQQLWAESLGKKKTLKGEPAPAASVPIPCRGATDQHSVLQQIAEGPQKKFVLFLRVQESETHGAHLQQSQFAPTKSLLQKSLGRLLGAEAEATQESLKEMGIPSISLVTEKLDESSVGQLLMLFQLLVGTLGTDLEINPFDQPGVERGKVLTRTILNH